MKNAFRMVIGTEMATTISIDIWINQLLKSTLCIKRHGSWSFQLENQTFVDNSCKTYQRINYCVCNVNALRARLRDFIQL